MPVMYTLRKNNNISSKSYGKYHAHAAIVGTIETEELAEIMQRNCTVKKSDILAVINELIETMQDKLQSSMRVKLNGFGSFKIGIENKGGGVEDPKTFNVNKHIKCLHICFTPELKKDKSGSTTKTFLTGATIQEAPTNLVDTRHKKDDDSQDGDDDDNG